MEGAVPVSLLTALDGADDGRLTAVDSAAAAAPRVRLARLAIRD